MSRHFPLLVLLTVASPFITLHTVLLARWDVPVAVEPAPETEQQDSGDEANTDSEIPDFASIDSVRERKSQFFDFIMQYVDQRNAEIIALRKRILNEDYSEEELRTWAKRYRVKWTTPEEVHTKLVKKVDVVPPSLVLAQAALESAWGTSRFAAAGNNFFGQWCYTRGCGMVPNRRHQGMSHEVQIFETPFDSVASYIRNLNSHPAYKGFREKRAEQRSRSERLSGCYLAHGLTQYSEKGDAYVESIKLLIRANRLEQDLRGYCAPIELVEEPEPAPAEPQTLAADQAQEEATPAPAPTTPPAG